MESMTISTALTTTNAPVVTTGALALVVASVVDMVSSPYISMAGSGLRTKSG